MKPEGKVIDFAKSGHLERLKYRGVFDFNKLMRGLRDWYIDQGYEFHETVYKHKVPSPAGAEQEIKWTGWRKINPYVRFWVDIYFKIWDLKDVEVIQNGQKKQMQQARLLIEFSGKCELDYSKRFAGSKFMQALQDWYNKFIVHKNIENIWTDELYYRILDIYSLAKRLLGMETAAFAAAGRY